MSLTLEACVREVLDVVMLVSRVIRLQMRSHRAPQMSVPQFRALLFVRRKPQVSISELADHLGLTRPTTTALVDKLVRSGWMVREGDVSDRRRVRLGLTRAGEAILASAEQQTQAYFVQRLGHLSEEERTCVFQAMQILRRYVLPEEKDLLREDKR